MARAAISHWALVNSYGFIRSLAIIFLDVQLPKVNVSLFGFVSRHLEYSAIGHEFGHALQNLIVNISPFKSASGPESQVSWSSYFSLPETLRELLLALLHCCSKSDSSSSDSVSESSSPWPAQELRLVFMGVVMEGD